MFFLSGDDGPTDFSQTPLRSTWYSRAIFRFFPQFLLFSRYYSHVFKWLPENSRMLNSSLFLLKRRGQSTCHPCLSNFSHICLQIMLALSLTYIHSLSYLCFHPVHPLTSLTVLTLASALQIVSFTATRTILLMKASLCHLSAQDHPGLSHLIFAVAYEASFSLLLFLLHLL